MFFGSCLAALKTLCVGLLLLFSPGTQIAQPQQNVVINPVCSVKNALECEAINASSYGIENQRLAQHFSEDPDCPTLFIGPLASFLYGCDDQDRVCLSSVKVKADHYMWGTDKYPNGAAEIKTAQKEIDFIGKSLQEQCDKQQKPFHWDPKNFERRSFVNGYIAPKK
jgi:hypothetical protein